MGLVWRNGDLNQLATKLSARGKDAERIAEEILDTVVEQAAWDMRNLIETRGTGYNGHTGRVEQGYMLADVGENQGEIEKSGHTLTGRFGWGVNGGPVEPYYLYQEQGFKNSWTGRDVPPMHALLDAFVKARNNMIRLLAKATR